MHRVTLHNLLYEQLISDAPDIYDPDTGVSREVLAQAADKDIKAPSGKKGIIVP